MSDYKTFRVRVRATVIADLDVRVWAPPWSGVERQYADVVAEASAKSRRVILQHARRPISGGDFEVLTIEPSQRVVS